MRRYPYLAEGVGSGILCSAIDLSGGGGQGAVSISGGTMGRLEDPPGSAYGDTCQSWERGTNAALPLMGRGNRRRQTCMAEVSSLVTLSLLVDTRYITVT